MYTSPISNSNASQRVVATSASSFRRIAPKNHRLDFEHQSSNVQQFSSQRLAANNGLPIPERQSPPVQQFSSQRPAANNRPPIPQRQSPPVQQSSFQRPAANNQPPVYQSASQRPSSNVRPPSSTVQVAGQASNYFGPIRSTSRQSKITFVLKYPLVDSRVFSLCQKSDL